MKFIGKSPLCMVPLVSAETWVYKWAKLFEKGRRSVEDKDRPGKPTEVISPKVIESVNDFHSV